MLGILIWNVPSANTGVPIQKKLFHDLMYVIIWIRFSTRKLITDHIRYEKGLKTFGSQS